MIDRAHDDATTIVAVAGVAFDGAELRVYFLLSDGSTQFVRWNTDVLRETLGLCEPGRPVPPSRRERHH